MTSVLFVYPGSTKLASSAPPASSSPLSKCLFPSTKERFVMPTEAPPKDKWVQDSATSVCMVCQVETFSMVSNENNSTNKTSLYNKKLVYMSFWS